MLVENQSPDAVIFRETGDSSAKLTGMESGLENGDSIVLDRDMSARELSWPAIGLHDGATIPSTCAVA